MMTWRAWLAGVLAILVLCTAQAEENSDRVTGRANGLTIRFAVQPAATAEGWAGFHKPTDADTVIHPTRPDLNRHLVVELVDEKSGRPVTDATVEVVMTPRNAPSKSYPHRLDRMGPVKEGRYGAVVTIDPRVQYVVAVAVRRPDNPEISTVTFDTVSVK
jgi:hypothetical protein